MAQTDGEPEEITSVFALSGKSGFVMAPFAPDRRHPVLVLRPDWCDDLQPDSLLAEEGGLPDNIKDLLKEVLKRSRQKVSFRVGTRAHYAIDFANFHSHIMEGEFTKIVLARCAREPNDGRLSPLQLFVKACREYPRLFVALVSARRCGTWLMATPEVLLDGDGNGWSTMSLAGTMTLSDQQLSFDVPPTQGRHDEKNLKWSVKNIEEQRFVSTFITESLEQVATDIEEKGPYTMRAGNLVHLRSDFSFAMPDKERVGELLHLLYPTPAVCGLPKEEARDFIVHNEFAPRLYYSGFAGPFDIEGATHLFVALRCMRIDADCYNLYAGGGLLADSEEEAEWRETEDKMETMRHLIND